jgi:hypothetical protein
MTTVIGLTGRKGSGKDTAASVLVRDYGFGLVKFADPLKNMLSALFAYQGASEDEIYRMLEGDLKEVGVDYLQGKTPREAMQTIGTEWGRNLIGENIWTDAAKRRIALCHDAIVTDLRFPNELRILRELGAITVRIVRPSLYANSFSAHPSEQFIDEMEVDAEIINDGSERELQDKLCTLVEQFWNTRSAR